MFQIFIYVCANVVLIIQLSRKDIKNYGLTCLKNSQNINRDYSYARFRA